jgi:hypothetical protein
MQLVQLRQKSIPTARCRQENESKSDMYRRGCWCNVVISTTYQKIKHSTLSVRKRKSGNAESRQIVKRIGVVNDKFKTKKTIRLEKTSVMKVQKR